MITEITWRYWGKPRRFLSLDGRCPGRNSNRERIASIRTSCARNLGKLRWSSLPNFGTRYRWVVSLMLLLLFHGKYNNWYPSDQRIGGPQSSSTRLFGDEEKDFFVYCASNSCPWILYHYNEQSEGRENRLFQFSATSNELIYRTKLSPYLMRLAQITF